MKFEQFVQNRLAEFGLDCEIDNDRIKINGFARKVFIIFDDEWRQAYKNFTKARSKKFDVQTRIFNRNNIFEIYLDSLMHNSYFDSHRLTDKYRNSVEISNISKEFRLAFFETDEYKEYFKRLPLKRISSGNLINRRFDSLFWTGTTAKYYHAGRKTPPDLNKVAMHAIKSSLFKVALEHNDTYVIWKKKNQRNLFQSDNTEFNYEIPQAKYDDDIVGYYKIAKSSLFPSQSFLAYYHIMEFFFLRVAESNMQDKIVATINNPSFSCKKAEVDKLISIVRGQDAKNDETEMLRNVLEKFIREEDLIEYIDEVENKIGEKIYTKERIMFGEKIFISPKKGHVLSNSAKALKHIRNAIVHSSDRYTREDCHIPFSSSEDLIEEFIPLVRYCSERVIFGTAE